MKITLLKEVIRMQKIAGILKENDDLDLSDTPEFRNIPKKVSNIIAKHEDALLAALKVRQIDPEDIDAYNELKAHLEAIANELGVDSTIPFVEDELYSGRVTPEEALQYTKEMFNDFAEETL